MHTYDSMNYFRAAWICMTSIDNLPLASLHSWQPQLHLEEHLFAVPLQAPAHADLAIYDMTILCSLMFSCQISILSMVRMIVIDGVQKSWSKATANGWRTRSQTPSERSSLFWAWWSCQRPAFDSRDRTIHMLHKLKETLCDLVDVGCWQQIGFTNCSQGTSVSLNSASMARGSLPCSSWAKFWGRIRWQKAFHHILFCGHLFNPTAHKIPCRHVLWYVDVCRMFSCSILPAASYRQASGSLSNELGVKMKGGWGETKFTCRNHGFLSFAWSTAREHVPDTYWHHATSSSQL